MYVLFVKIYTHPGCWNPTREQLQTIFSTDCGVALLLTWQKATGARSVVQHFVLDLLRSAECYCFCFSSLHFTPVLKVCWMPYNLLSENKKLAQNNNVSMSTTQNHISHCEMISKKRGKIYERFCTSTGARPCELEYECSSTSPLATTSLDSMLLFQ